MRNSKIEYLLNGKISKEEYKDWLELAYQEIKEWQKFIIDLKKEKKHLKFAKRKTVSWKKFVANLKKGR